MTRQQAAGDAQLSAELVKKLFQLRTGEIADGPALSGNSHSVVRLVKITKAVARDEPDRLKQLDEMVRNSMTEDVLAQYRAALQKKYDVEINDSIIDSLFDELNVRG
jgi:hypothetical protein